MHHAALTDPHLLERDLKLSTQWILGPDANIDIEPLETVPRVPVYPRITQLLNVVPDVCFTYGVDFYFEGMPQAPSW
jgi:hypothetical protein